MILQKKIHRKMKRAIKQLHTFLILFLQKVVQQPRSCWTNMIFLFITALLSRTRCVPFMGFFLTKSFVSLSCYCRNKLHSSPKPHRRATANRGHSSRHQDWHNGSICSDLRSSSVRQLPWFVRGAKEIFICQCNKPFHRQYGRC